MSEGARRACRHCALVNVSKCWSAERTRMLWGEECAVVGSRRPSAAVLWFEGI